MQYVCNIVYCIGYCVYKRGVWKVVAWYGDELESLQSQQHCTSLSLVLPHATLYRNLSSIMCLVAYQFSDIVFYKRWGGWESSIMPSYPVEKGGTTTICQIQKEKNHQNNTNTPSKQGKASCISRQDCDISLLGF